MTATYLKRLAGCLFGGFVLALVIGSQEGSQDDYGLAFRRAILGPRIVIFLGIGLIAFLLISVWPRVTPYLRRTGVRPLTAGVVTVLASLTLLRWYDQLGDGKFATLAHAATATSGLEPLAKAYFGWLAWTLLGLTIAGAIAVVVLGRPIIGWSVAVLAVAGALLSNHAHAAAVQIAGGIDHSLGAGVAVLGYVTVAITAGSIALSGRSAAGSEAGGQPSLRSALGWRPGFLLAVLGVLVGIISFGQATWFAPISRNLTVRDTQAFFVHTGLAPVATQYLLWLGWVLFGATLIGALTACYLGNRLAGWVTVLFGVAGVFCTLITMYDISAVAARKSFDSATGPWQNLGSGGWLACGAFFVLAGAGFIAATSQFPLSSRISLSAAAVAPDAVASDPIPTDAASGAGSTLLTPGQQKVPFGDGTTVVQATADAAAIRAQRRIGFRPVKHARPGGTRSSSTRSSGARFSGARSESASPQQAAGQAGTRARSSDQVGIGALAAPGSRKTFLVIAIAAALFYPPTATGFWQQVLVSEVGIYLLLAIGLNVVVGWAGLLDLGFIAFYAIGSYTTAYLVGSLPIKPPSWLTLSPLLAIPFAIVICLIAGVALGAPTLRLRGDYLAIVTLGFGEIIRIVAINATNVTNSTRGPSPSVPHPVVHLGPVHLTWGLAALQYWYLLLVLILVVVLLFHRLEGSRLGRAWAAVREDEVAAQATGIDTTRVKLLAFAIGASTSGVAGVFFASQIGYFNPDNFVLNNSILVVAYVVFGGMGSLPGAMAGAALLTWLPEFLKAQVPAEDRQIWIGAVVLLMMIFRPAGLIPARRRAAELSGFGAAASAEVSAVPAGEGMGVRA